MTKAVFPVAGLGTRFLPATKAMPKELLPIVDKPLIQYAVEEAYEAGIREMIFITGRYKRAIEDHFDKSPALEAELIEKGKTELLEIVRGIAPKDVSFVYIRQPEALGLGHAVLCAQPVIGEEPFAVILADDLINAQESVTGQLIRTRQHFGGGNVLAVENVPLAETKKYGIVSVDDAEQETSIVRSIIEKPSPEVAPSTLAVIGRYIFEPEIFEYLKNIPRGVGGEIQLTDAIKLSLEQRKCYACIFTGERYDIGDKFGYIKATLDFALRRDDLKDSVRDYILKLAKEI